MKITQTPAQKFRWAKRSLSIVICAAMLLTTLAFVGSVPAFAYLQVTDMGIASPPGGYTFVVPETIYLKPAVSGAVKPQYFLNNDINGKAVQNETEESMKTGKLYIGHENAFAYKLYYKGDRVNPRMTYTCKMQGELWMPKVNASTDWLAEPSYIGQNTSQAREWFVEMYMDTDNDGAPDTWENLLNVGAVYQPMHTPSLYAYKAKRGGSGIEVNYLVSLNGLHTNVTGGNQNGANGYLHPPFSGWDRWYPLLNDVQGILNGDNNGGKSSYDFMNSGTTTAEYPLTGRATAQTPDNGQNNSNNGYNPVSALATNSSANHGKLRIDTSRNTTFRGIPNFSLGFAACWAADNKRPNASTSRTQFRALNSGDTVSYKWRDDSGAGFTNVSLNKVRENAGTSSIFFTDETSMNDLLTATAASQQYQVFSLRCEWNSLATAGDWYVIDNPIRINIDSSSKGEMRRRYQNTIWQGPLRAGVTPSDDHTSAMTNIGFQLADPKQGEWQSSMDGWSQIARPDVSDPSSATVTCDVLQDYIFHDAGGITTTVHGNGKIDPFTTASVAPKSYAIATGNYALTSPFQSRANARVEINVPAYKDPVLGYVYTHSTVNGAAGTFPMVVDLLGSITVEHHYTPVTYNIKYDGNGATANTMTNSVYAFNEQKALESNVFEKTGFVFAGWSTSKSGAPVYANNASVVNLTTNPKADDSTTVTLYAKWTQADITVNFNADGGSFASAGDSSRLVQFDGKYGDLGPLPVPTFLGYTFDGWWDAANKKITAATVVKDATDPQVLKAKWNLETFDITFDVQGGAPLAAADAKISGAVFTDLYPALPVSTRDNYDFQGWSTVQSDPTLADVVAENDPIGTDIMTGRTLYAQWTPKEYTVTFDPLGGVLDAAWVSANPTEEITVKYGETYPALADLDLTQKPADAIGFDCWYVDGGDGTPIAAGSPVTATGNHVLKAKWDGILPGVTFDKDGGVFTQDTLTNKDVVKGEKYGFLPVPTKIGYDFLGWYDAANNVVDEDTIVPTADPHKIYAKWEAKDFVVTFMPEGGTAAQASKTVTYDEPYGEASEGTGIVWLPATRPGYTFGGWYTEPAGAGAMVDDTTTLNTAKDHKLYALWAANSYTVTFDTNGGPLFSDISGDPADDEKTVVFGSAYGTLADAPARMGYIFDGWWTDPVAGTKVRETTPVTNSTDPGHSIYAHWTAIPIVVTFTDSLGINTFTPATKKVALDAKYGTLPTPPATDGYVFDTWWNVDEGIPVDADTLVPADAVAHDLEARWLPADIDVTVDYDDGVTVNVGTAKYTETYVNFPELDTTPSRLGFMFIDWSLEGVSGVRSTSPVVLTKPHTIIALWDGGTNTVNYNVGPAPVTPADGSFKNGLPYGDLLAEPEYPGYELIGWHKMSDLSDPAITKETEVYLTGTTTLYAEWAPKTLKVSFDANGGTAITDTVDVTFADPYPAYADMPEAEYPGYEFIGWEDEDGTPVADGVTAVTIPKNHKLKALWKANKIKVNFDADGGVFLVTGEETRDVMFGKTYGKLFDGTDAPLPVPVLGGYAIDGWYTERDGEGRHIKASSEVKTPEEHTLYPNWVESDLEIKLYRNYDAADETFRAVGVEFNAAYGLALSPLTRKGYTFEGWFATPAADPATDTPVGPDDIASDATLAKLYAVWTLKTPTVTFKFNDGTTADAGKTVTYGEKYSTATGGFPVPTRTGYEFGGWWTSEDPIGSKLVTADTDMNQEEDHDLYARWEPATYEITFDTDSGLPATIDPKEVTVGKNYGALTTPTRDGYTFGGWALDTTEIVTAGSTVTKLVPHMLTAQWTPAEYVLTFNGNGGTPAQATKKVTYGALYGDVSEVENGAWLPATRSGYDFDGWWTDAAAGTQVDNTTTVAETKPHTVYAHWTVRTDIKVTLDPNGGTFANPADAEFNDAELDQLYPAGIDAEPEYPGYVFAGWYTKETTGTLVDNTVKVTNGDDHTLYARWTLKDDIKVTLDPNDGASATLAPFDATFTKAYGPKLNQKSERAGYEFAGWYDAATGGNPVNKDTIVTDAGDHTLYAQWTDHMVTVTFNFNDDGATANETRTYRSNETYDDGVEGTMPVLTRTGYTGVWCTADSANGGTVLTGADVLDAPKDHTLYARWTAKDDIQVTLDLDGGNGVTPLVFNVTFDAAYGSKLDKKPTKSGYEFDGWYDAATGGNAVDKDTIVENLTNHTIYAYWEVKPYTLTLDNNYDGAPAAATKPIVYGVAYGTLDTPAARVGYNFLGWSAAKNDTALANEETAATIAGTGNRTLYAQWEAKNNIKVTLNSNGGSTVAAPEFDVTYGLWYKNGTAYNNELNQVPTLAGFTFSGWYDAATGGRKITPDTPVIDEDNHILYARWDSEKFGLRLDPQLDGTDAEGMFVEAGKPYSYNPYSAAPNVFPVPTCIGYTFTGWYDAPTGGTKAQLTDTVPAGTVKLYAHWAANSYNVKFDADGGTPVADRSVTFDAAYGTLPAPTRAGYQFGGWFTASDKAITAATIFNKDIMTMPAEHTLKAKWTPRSYTITLYAAGGILAGTDSITVTYDRTYSALPTPTRSGYTFDGWFTNADVKITPADTVKVTSDTALTARWTLIPPPNTYRLTVVKGTGGGNYLANTAVTITADPASTGQVFDKWVVTSGKATIADTANPNTTLTMSNGSVTVEARYKSIVSKKMIFTTKYESKFWNWMMFIFLFGWIWMWFVK